MTTADTFLWKWTINRSVLTPKSSVGFGPDQNTVTIACFQQYSFQTSQSSNGLPRTNSLSWLGIHLESFQRWLQPVSAIWDRRKLSIWSDHKGNQKSKFFCRFKSLWNVHKPNFRLIPWATPKLLGQKKSKFYIRSKFIVRSKFSCSTVFFSLSIFY